MGVLMRNKGHCIDHYLMFFFLKRNLLWATYAIHEMNMTIRHTLSTYIYNEISHKYIVLMTIIDNEYIVISLSYDHTPAKTQYYTLTILFYEFIMNKFMIKLNIDILELNK